MMSKTKKTAKKIAVAAVGMTLAASMGVSTLAASAMQGVGSEQTAAIITLSSRVTKSCWPKPKRSISKLRKNRQFC